MGKPHGVPPAGGRLATWPPGRFPFASPLHVDILDLLDKILFAPRPLRHSGPQTPLGDLVLFPCAREFVPEESLNVCGDLQEGKRDCFDTNMRSWEL